MGINGSVGNYNAFRRADSVGGEIPYSSHTGLDKAVGHLLRMLHGHREDSDSGIQFPAPVFEFVDMTLIYSFSENKDLERALDRGKKYLEKYAGAREVESWIVE